MHCPDFSKPNTCSKSPAKVLRNNYKHITSRTLQIYVVNHFYTLHNMTCSITKSCIKIQ